MGKESNLHIATASFHFQIYWRTLTTWEGKHHVSSLPSEWVAGGRTMGLQVYTAQLVCIYSAHPSWPAPTSLQYSGTEPRQLHKPSLPAAQWIVSGLVPCWCGHANSGITGGITPPVHTNPFLCEGCDYSIHIFTRQIVFSSLTRE